MKSARKKFKRVHRDKYYTPISLTGALLAAEYFQHVLDPAAGAGHILDACALAGITAEGFDIAPDRPSIAKRNFFDVTTIGETDILANPPFGQLGLLACRFIVHSLVLTERMGGKVCMLLQADFDSGKTRRPLFEDHPAFARKYVLTERIYWANLEATERSSSNHAFYVWDWARDPAQPRDLRYLHSPDGKPFR